MNRRWTILAALVLAFGATAGAEDELVWKDGKWVRVAPPEEGTAAGELSIVRRDVDRQHYKTAVKHAKRFLKRYPGDPLSEQVYSLAGEAEMNRSRHWQAYQWYEKQLVYYPSGALAERAMEREVEIAEAFLTGKKRPAAKIFRVSAVDDGLEILQKIAERAPGSQRAQLALITIGDYHFNKGDWLVAGESYDRFLELFPKSTRAAHAEIRAAESHRNSYRGPAYDETPLVEAEQRYKSFLAHYPARAAEYNARENLAQIRADRAEKQLYVAKFYLRTDHPKAAAEYLKLVLRDYPDAPSAHDAAALLAGIDPAAADALAPPSTPSPVDPPTPTTAPATHVEAPATAARKDEK